MLAVTNQKGGVFFLHGYGGTGKTYMWRTLASALRSKHEIVLTVATSGIASLLLPGGRTAHSKFKMPVPTLDNSTCKIDHDSDMAQLLRETKLIIWDEAPMAHRYTFECLDRTLKDIMSTPTKRCETIFGGKVIVFGGDFRQILPVIPRGNRSDIVHASINASYIWDHCQVLTLTKNMRLKHGTNSIENEEIAQFSNWLLNVGEGKISEPNDGYAEIQIPTEMLITDFDDPILAIIQSTYPNFLDNYKSYEYLKSRAILASTIEVVDQINDYVLDLMPGCMFYPCKLTLIYHFIYVLYSNKFYFNNVGDERIYNSANSIDRSEIHDNNITDVLTPEFLSTLRTSGLPNHQIKLKVGCPIMLLRNIDQSEGLCNGTRLIVTKMANHVLEAKIMGGKHHGNIIYIPRMDMSPSQSPWPFKLCRRQFPIVVSYSMTINKSQGQSLDWVGLYLPKDVFSHGQIYVAISRVTSKKGIKILIHDEKKQAKDSTTNVVYKEVFQNVY
jgi:ATP-dependent DNA helicase PIF1